MSWIGDKFDALDEVVLAGHQRVADWAFTLFATSPYYIAANIGGWVAVLGLTYCGLGIALYGVRPIGILYVLINILVGAIYYWDGRRAHEQWLKGKLYKTTQGVYFVRMFWLIIVLVFDVLLFTSTMINIYYEGLDYKLLRMLITTFYDVSCASACYFLSCTAPTLRNWNFNPLPQAT